MTTSSAEPKAAADSGHGGYALLQGAPATRHCEIDRLPDLTREVCVERYLNSPGRPVILTDVMSEWPAMEKWNFAFLKRSYGADAVTVADRLAAPTAVKDTHLGTYIDYLTDERHTWLKHCQGTSPWYLGYYKPFARHPELMQDFAEPDCLDNWFRFLTDDMVDWYRQGFGWLFVGPAGTQTAPHPDLLGTHAWLAQILGRKRYILTEPLPRDSGPDDVPDSRFFDVVLEPGEFLILPANWIHGAVSLEASITLSFNTLNAGNFSAFIESTYAEHERWRRMAHRAAGRSKGAQTAFGGLHRKRARS